MIEIAELAEVAKNTKIASVREALDKILPLDELNTNFEEPVDDDEHFDDKMLWKEPGELVKLKKSFDEEVEARSDVEAVHSASSWFTQYLSTFREILSTENDLLFLSEFLCLHKQNLNDSFFFPFSLEVHRYSFVSDLFLEWLGSSFNDFAPSSRLGHPTRYQYGISLQQSPVTKSPAFNFLNHPDLPQPVLPEHFIIGELTVLLPNYPDPIYLSESPKYRVFYEELSFFNTY